MPYEKAAGTWDQFSNVACSAGVVILRGPIPYSNTFKLQNFFKSRIMPLEDLEGKIRADTPNDGARDVTLSTLLKVPDQNQNLIVVGILSRWGSLAKKVEDQ